MYGMRGESKFQDVKQWSLHFREFKVQNPFFSLLTKYKFTFATQGIHFKTHAIAIMI